MNMPDKAAAQERMTQTFQRSVVIVEDDSFLRSLTADALEKAGFLVSTAATIADGRRVIRAVDPDAVVLDIDFGPGPTGFDLADAIRKSSPDIAIVFLTTQPDPRFADRDAKSVSKSEAYLNKNLLSDTSTLVEALEAVLTDGDVAEFRHHELETRPLVSLSKTQVQVLKLLAAGKTNQQIANERKRSLGATESAITRTLEAIGIAGDAEINARVAAAMKYAALVGAITE
jgi:DNA-binding NarL/FixJ family response regulator